jgi:hypothetical protein
MEEEKGRPWIRMEEEEEAWPPQRHNIGFTTNVESEEERKQRKLARSSEAYQEFLKSLADERRKILDDDKLSARQKYRLLDENRKMVVVANGGTVRKTENMVYSILVFGGTVLVILALLTVYKNLPHEVTLSFVGTVLGGTIATIAQKLGKL